MIKLACSHSKYKGKTAKKQVDITQNKWLMLAANNGV